LGDSFLSDLTSNSGQVFVQLTTLAAMLHTPAIPDFMSLVIADARRQYKTELPPNAWRDFIQDRGKIVPGMSELSESTLRKSGTNMIRILVESGYLESSRNKKFQPVYLMPETLRWLEKLDRPDFKNVMECTL
jgi:hypothetical protein